MPDDIKDFIIFCTNTKEEKEEIIKLRIKNMPDSDEREMIAFLDKKKKYLLDIFYFVTGWSVFVCIFLMLKHKDALFAFFFFFGLLLVCILKVAFEETLWKYFIKWNGNELLLQYLKDYSAQEWRCLQNTIEKAYSILNLLNARTPEGMLVSANPQNQAAAISIVFYVSYFKMNWTSYAENGDQIQKEDLFNIGHVIKNCKLEKDTVEYDFLKNELRVPLNFIYDF